MIEVTCPKCQTVGQFDEMGRDANSFCPVCEFPLFWMNAAPAGDGEGGRGDDPGLRRLPGTGGLSAVATIGCWKCNEPNPITGVYCIRCAVELHPAPVVVAPLPPPLPEQPPELPPLPPPPPWIPAAWVPALVMTIILVLFSLLGGLVALLR
jgi:hypothetical protein